MNIATDFRNTLQIYRNESNAGHYLSFVERTFYLEMKRKASFPFAFHSFIRNFLLLWSRKLLRLDKKRNEFLCFVLDFS